MKTLNGLKASALALLLLCLAGSCNSGSNRNGMRDDTTRFESETDRSAPLDTTNDLDGTTNENRRQDSLRTQPLPPAP